AGMKKRNELAHAGSSGCIRCTVVARALDPAQPWHVAESLHLVATGAAVNGNHLEPHIASSRLDRQQTRQSPGVVGTADHDNGHARRRLAVESEPGDRDHRPPGTRARVILWDCDVRW